MDSVPPRRPETSDPVVRNIRAVAQLERAASLKRPVFAQICDRVTHDAGTTWSIALHGIWFAGWMGLNTFGARRFDQAVPKLLLAIQDDPSFPAPYRFLAACYAYLDRFDDARETIARLRAMTTVVMPDSSHFRSAEHRELLLSGLRLAAGCGGRNTGDMDNRR